MQPPSFVPTSAVPEYFDYLAEAAAASIDSDDLAQIVRVFEADYPNDLMLRELHILRACHAIREGRATLRQIIAPQAA